MWPDNRIVDLFDIELPITQAPMAGSVLSDMVAAVSEAGGLGSTSAIVPTWRCLPRCTECRPFRTSSWRLLLQNAGRVFECLTSAWPCNAFLAQNSYLL
jgi:Nitronate monooxygenase